MDAGLSDQAGPLVDRYLAEDPTSARLRRLRARLDLARGAPAEAGRRLDALAREQPQDAALTAELAAAEVAAGRWNRALDLYGRLLEGDPDNRDVLAAYREILLGHAPRVELSHYTLLQQAATHHVEEAAWRGWLADRWWLRAGTRYGSYRQDRVIGQPGFTEEVWTALATLGLPADARGLALGRPRGGAAARGHLPHHRAARRGLRRRPGHHSPPSRSRSASCSPIRWSRCRATARPTG